MFFGSSSAKSYRNSKDGIIYFRFSAEKGTGGNIILTFRKIKLKVKMKI